MGDALVASALRLAVAALERLVVRRPVGGVERVESGIGRHRVALVGHRGVEPGRQHLGAARVSRERDERLARRQFLDGGQRPHPGDRHDAGLDGLGLVGGH